MSLPFPPHAPEGLEQIGCNKQFGGVNVRYRHASRATGSAMTFTVFFPPAAAAAPAPLLMWLSGLTCTDENFIQKSGAQRAAASAGVALVAPDTSPRGVGVEGEAAAWDFGVGAGFYLNATQPQWVAWRMEEYVTQELPALLAAAFGSYLDTSRVALSGHSMGGHGALVLGLRAAPGTYTSLSAFAPIAHPSVVPWGVKAFTGYLGEDRSQWAAYDCVELLRARGPGAPSLPPLLVDTGSADSFLAVQLKADDLEAACKEVGWDSATLRMQEGYDHSYFFISSFIEDHVLFHAKHLKA